MTAKKKIATRAEGAQRDVLIAAKKGDARGRRWLLL